MKTRGPHISENILLYLKNDSVTLQSAHIFKNRVDYVVIFVPLEETWSVLFEKINKVVEQKISACNNKNNDKIVNRLVCLFYECYKV